MEKLDDSLKSIAGFMSLAARTAPKARGKDNLVMKIFEKEELDGLADIMISTGKETSRPQTFSRDAESVRKSGCLLVIATKNSPLDLDCGFCGAATCEEARKKNITCAYNSGDLGIAVGSAVATAACFHADNRLMYTVGFTVIKHDLMGDGIVMALGIPLSATGKNPFFDR
ncbi:MAG: DUF2148 domain-containing protein [Elusimicrobiota bacterium]